MLAELVFSLFGIFEIGEESVGQLRDIIQATENIFDELEDSSVLLVFSIDESFLLLVDRTRSGE